MPLFLQWTDLEFETKFAGLIAEKKENSQDVGDIVADILRQVKTRGDDALVEYCAKFDGLDITPDQFLISQQRIDAAMAECDPKVIDALKLAHQRITDYHARQMPQDDLYEDDAGITLGHRWNAVDSVCLYVPGGLASYPSSVLMNAAPAKEAGVNRIVMTVPTPNGVLNPLVLAAAKIAGVDEVYGLGGAQAVAAFAYGTKTIEPVAKIVGPGNAYVAAAKRQVFGVVGIDMIAGPSEILVLADDENHPNWIAADLLAQAEHDISAQSILIVTSEKFGKQVLSAIDDELALNPRHEIARASWQNNGGIIVAEDWEHAAKLANIIAPEHLELALEEPEAIFDMVDHCGAVFLGRYTPEAVGDYVGGPNHVLPTAKSAKFSSGLNVLDFMKRTSILKCSAEGLDKIGSAGAILGHAEGLFGHARSIELRLNANQQN
ncbi:MAG: histidinol dehydrogenase [Rhizobiales bacterium]|nr:histidinol dehydrogenase [Hyphomicrobiales bacterium]NRB15414.1 histidinol dehydrogenase [Hyphomicrobiales bacterium]